MERQINIDSNGYTVDEALENLRRTARYYAEHPLIARINREYIASRILAKDLSPVVLSLSPEDKRFNAAKKLWDYYEGLYSDHRQTSQ